MRQREKSTIRSLRKRNQLDSYCNIEYQSHCLFYDRETESLWLPQKGLAIAGPLAGQKLKRIALRKEPLAAWLEEHPRTRVLERPFLKQIDYRYSPFSTHWVSTKVPYPVDHVDPRFHPKDLVFGIVYPGGSKAYLGSAITEAGGKIVDEINGKPVRIAYDSSTASFRAEVPPSYDSYESYWFAWKALFPDTAGWEGPAPLRSPGATD